MKSVLFSVIILLSLSFQSCRDNFSVPTPASRNYQQDESDKIKINGAILPYINILIR